MECLFESEDAELAFYNDGTIEVELSCQNDLTQLSMTMSDIEVKLLYEEMKDYFGD